MKTAYNLLNASLLLLALVPAAAHAQKIQQTRDPQPLATHNFRPAIARAAAAPVAAPAAGNAANSAPRPGAATGVHPDGSQITPTITWATPAPINFGIGLSSTQLDATASSSGSPVAGTFTYAPPAGTVLPVGSNTLSVTFTPTNTTLYTNASATVTQVVNNTPQIFWATPNPIAYGTPLGPDQLNAQAYPQGTFTYSPAPGTILPIGNTPVTVTFTPRDTSTYAVNTKTRTVTVTNMVAINWATPAPVVIGTALSQAQQTATSYNSIPGTFAYSPAIGTVLPVGNNPLSVTFTPRDTTTYAANTVSVPLAVYKAPATEATSTSLAASTTTLLTGQVLTLISTTTQTGSGVTGGTVTFFDTNSFGNPVQIGTARLVGSHGGAGLQGGQSSIKVRLGPGSHSLTAQFADTGNSRTSTSPPTVVTVTGTEPSALALTTTADTTTPANHDFLAVISGFGHSLPGGSVTFKDQSTGTTLGTSNIVAEASNFNFSVTSTPTPTQATGIGTADVNNDGAQDLVVVTYDSAYITLSVSVSLGNGDGTYQDSVSYTINADSVNTYSPTGGSSGYFNAVAIADLDGDGYADLVVTDSNSGTINVLMNNGDGTFKKPVAYGTGNQSDTFPYPNGTFPQGVSLADLNGDGILDAVVGNNGTGTIAVMLGSGDGGFNASTEYQGSGGNQLAVADYAGTGNLGVAVSGGSGALPVFLGNGDGSLQAPIFVPIGIQTIGVVTADFNGDNKPDLAVLDQVGNTVSIALGNGDGTFKAATSYPTSGDPVSLVAADFNADGTPDIAVANYVGTGTHTQAGTISNLSLLLGKGDGTLSAQAIFPIGSSAIAATDLNGDGVVDLADAGQTAVTIVLGGTALQASLTNVAIPGSGAQTIQATYNPSQSSIYTTSSQTVTVAGNGTGAPAVVTWPTPASISYGTPLSAAQLDATANVAGTFVYTPAAGAVLPIGSNTLSVTFTPTDTVNYSAVTQTVTLLVTQGVPVITWHTPAPVPTGTALSAAQLNATADVPGTFVYSPAAGFVPPVGNTLLTVTFTPTDTATYQTATASVVLGVLTAAPTLGTTTSLTLSSTTSTTTQIVTLSASTTLTSGAAAITAGTITFYDGTGALGTVEIVGTRAASGFTSSGASLKARFGPGIHPIVAKFSGTGQDIASVSPAQELTVTGTEASTITLTAAPNTTTPANYDFTATVSGFGHASPAGVVNFTDLTTNTVLGSQTITNATGVFNLVPAPAVPISESISAATADLNGDGFDDLVVEYYTNSFATLNVAVSLGVGDGTFTAPQNYVIGTSTGYYYETVTVADLNQDGVPDIIATSAINTDVIVLLGKGDGTFAAPVDYTVPNGTEAATVGDVNGDGIPDVVAANGVLLGAGDGTLLPQVNYPAGIPGGVAIALGSFTGSGKVDVVLADSTGSVDVLPGNGDGSFQTAIASAVGKSPNAIAVGDFNGDGKTDVAVANSGDDTISVLLGNGDGSFAPQVTYPVGRFPTSVVTADVNGDGRPDLLVGNFSSANVSVLLGQGDGTFVAQAPLAVSSESLAVADFNGDGVVDLADAGQALTIVLGGTSLTTKLTNVALPSAGQQVVQAAFAPAANSIYTPSTQTVTITGNGSLATEAFTWATPAAIPFGTPLSATQLDAVASVAGTIVYTPAAGTMLSVGSHTLSATFTPTDTIDYKVLTQTVTLVVTQATPVITWPTPAPIAVGSAITAAQLDATASVPGTFVYTPPAGTVPLAGNNTLSVTFTPTDTVDYTIATATVNLAVTGGAAGAVLSGPLTSNPGTQPQVTLTLTQPYPIDLVATFTLSVQPAVAGGVVDPAIQFAGGGTTYAYTIPAGSTTVPPVLFSAGTVASTITVSVTFTAAGVNVTPTTLQPLVVQVPAAAPVVASATLVRSGKVLTVVVQGSSSTRDVTQATFAFQAATGQTVSDASVTVAVTPDFATWYQNTSSDAFGSGFLYTQQFLLSNDATAIGSVTVTLTNAIGASNVETAQ